MSNENSYTQQTADLLLQRASSSDLADLADHPDITIRRAALRHPNLPAEIFYARLPRVDSVAVWDNPLVEFEMISGKPLAGLRKVYRTASAARDSDARDFIDKPGMRTMLSWMLKWWNSQPLSELVRFSAQHVLWRSTHRDFFPCVDMLGMGSLPTFPEREMRAEAARALHIVQAKMTLDNEAMDFLRSYLQSCREWEEPDAPWAHWRRALSKSTYAFRYATDDLPDKAMEVTNHLIAAGYTLTEDTFRARFPHPPANCKETLWSDLLPPTP